jgi:hypothetical protein
MEQRKKGYVPLLLLTIVFTILALSTLIPQASASKECILGYRAHCTFTPISTLICLAISGLLCVLRKRLLTL